MGINIGDECRELKGKSFPAELHPPLHLYAIFVNKFKLLDPGV